MIPGDKYKLIDQVNGFNGHLYGNAGDEVTIIADHVNVMIVEDKKGNRFSVERGNLTNDESQIIKKIIEPIKQYSKPTAKKKSVRAKQSNIF